MTSSENPVYVDPLRSAEMLFNRTFASAKEVSSNRPKQTPANMLVPGETLRPFQLAGLAHWENAGKRAMMGWEPGLGKTFAGVAAINKMARNNRAVIITKDIDRHKWQRAVHKYCGGRRAYIYNLDPGASKSFVDDINSVLVVGWATIHRIVDPIVEKMIKIYLAVVDECQKMGNPKSQRTKAARKLLANVPEVIALSGTPALHTPIQLWPILDAMQPGQWDTYWNFCMRYGKPKHTGFGWKFTGASNVKDLHNRLKPVIHRVLKSDPDIGMPEKTRIIVPIHPTNIGDYKRLESLKFKEWTDLKGDAREVEMGHLAIVNALRQTATAGKMKQVVEWVRNFLIDNPDHKFVLFCHHLEAAALLVAELSQDSDDWTTLSITGNTPPRKKPDIEAQFKDDPRARLIVCTDEAAGASIELHAASYMGVVEFPWGPEDMVQVEDRIDRMVGVNGGKPVPGTYYYFVALNTLDEGFVQMMHRKMQDVRGALDGVGSKSASMFADLVEGLDKLIRRRAEGKKDVPQI